MQQPDKDRILGLLIGKMPVREFESWLFKDLELESRIGSDMYFDLIDIDYRDSNSSCIVSQTLMGKHIDPVELKDFKYHKVLEQAGWYHGRKTEQTVTSKKLTPELKNARDILTEFGGLELISPYKCDYWTPRNICFPETIERLSHGVKYGLDKPLICFAHIDDFNSALYIDDENNYYLLDDIANIDLFRFKGNELSTLLQNLMGLDEQGNFELTGSSNRK
ncbi:SUKH-3 domain-containing protein [Aureibacter tunicatorum]|uniref:Uncharacterized protein n=1 Tax=Aureibacter tunicatorum TaxID=866807 RepID=A0AAE3XSJ0_9BACT|nr:SUKH-3 domain-containing protein [Aureibacter tunicatorum]MDR6241200.1 hypothetical protein [Aureibacter tunicatorum]BDD03975.1 hypothetical protein AUTU_14580 [Aureibacter tunicatorum]